MDFPAKPSSMSIKAYELFKGATYAERRHTLTKQKPSKSDAFDDKFHSKILREAVDSNQIIDQIRTKEKKSSKKTKEENQPLDTTKEEDAEQSKLAVSKEKAEEVKQGQSDKTPATQEENAHNEEKKETKRVRSRKANKRTTSQFSKLYASQNPLQLPSKTKTA